MLRILLISILVFVVSCAHVSRTNKLSLGMSRADFEKIMGSPETTKGHADQMYLTYSLMERRGFPVQYGDYVFVFNKQNQLVQFGHARDFRDTVNVNVYHGN